MDTKSAVSSRIWSVIIWPYPNNKVATKLIEWLNEDVLHLYIDKDRIWDDEVLEIIISLDN